MALMQTLGNGMRTLMGSMGMGQSQKPAPRPESNPLLTTEDYITFVNKEFTRRQKDRTGDELNWRLGMEFLALRQFGQINPVTQTLDEIPLEHDYEEREVFDQIGPIYEVRIARLTRGKVIRKVRPASNQQRDISAAQVSGKLIGYTEHETEHQARLKELVSWMEATGTVYVMEPWDPGTGEIIGMMQPPPGEDGQPGGEPEEIREGGIKPDVCSCFEIYPDSLNATFARNRSIIHARAYHVDEIYDMWGMEVQPESCDSFTLQPLSSGLRNTGSTGLYRPTVTRLERHAVVKSYWERPSRRYSRGRYIVVANKTLLHAGELPFRVGARNAYDIPLVPLYCAWVPGQFFGKCLMPRLIPVQRRYNSLRNRKAEYLKRAAIGQLKRQEGSLVNEDEVESQFIDPGQEFIYKRGYDAPSYMEFPNLPTAFDTEIQDCLQEFKTLSGVSDLAKMGDAPAGVKSGVALSIAMEQDETRLSTPAANIEDALITEGKFWLRLYRQFAAGPRIARVTDRQEVELIDWTGSDLTSDDVILEGGSGLGESPAQRRQMVFDILGTGLFNDPGTGQLSRDGRAKLLEMIELGHWESAADTDYDLQVSRVKRQVARIKSGTLPVVESYDDPLVHLAVLRRWMLTGEFEELAAQQQPIQFAAYQFQAELMQVIQQQAMAQAALQAQTQAVANPQQPQQPPRQGPPGQKGQVA